ncbi:MAG: hypothetical protein V4805_20955 [Pseudomonadota bacterium]
MKIPMTGAFKRRLSRQPCSVVVGLSLLMLLPAHATDDASKRWVHGSWVNVRSSDASDSAVIAHVTSNTAVTLISQKDKSCEIAWGKGQRGFVACKLLGERLLSLAEVTTGSVGDKEHPQYSPPRAFWIAPSMAALFSAGRYFQQTLLTPQQLERENGHDHGQQIIRTDAPPPLTRYPVPEFEAMKAELGKGLIASADLNPPLLNCRQMQDAKVLQSSKGLTELQYPDAQHYPHVYMSVSDCRVEELPHLRLPQIRPSLFKSAKELAPGSAAPERLSANFGIVERGRVTGTPKWEWDYDMLRYTGAWDIGKYALTLERPVIEHVIGRTGLVGAYRWTPTLTETPFGPGGRCYEGLRNKRMGKTLLPGYPGIKDELMWFQAPAALPFQKAKIATRTERVPTPSNADGSVSKVAIYEIDLNGDAVPDFVQWDVWGTPMITGPNPLLKLRQVFANIGGEWYPFEQDSYGECT